MRHIRLFVILIATVATILSCQKSEELAIDIAGQTLTANAPGAGNDQAPETKVSFTEDGITQGQINLAWQVGDVITLYDKSNDRVGNWKVESVAPDGKANFTKVDGDALADGVDYTAVYPASTTEALEDRDLETIGAQAQKESDNMEHLDDNLRMKSAPFQLGSTISFAHEAAIITVHYKTMENPENFILKLDDTEYALTLTTTPVVNYTVNLMIPPTEVTTSLSAYLEAGSTTEIATKTGAVTIEAGKHYTWNTVPTEPFLASIDADHVPEGDEWTIEDADATASSIDNFAGLKAALDTVEASRTINLVFPNLTTLPESAFSLWKPAAKWSVSAPNVTSLPSMPPFVMTENLTKIDLPKAVDITKIVHYFGDLISESLVELTIATEARITNESVIIFKYINTENVNLITHESNVEGMKFKFLNDRLSTPFKSVNGVSPEDGLMLVYIDAENVPEGDEWTIEDTNETAGSSADFAGLIAALGTIDASRTINLVFPNLTTLPKIALRGCQPAAKWTFSAPNVTIMSIMCPFSETKNLTKIDLPKTVDFGKILNYSDTSYISESLVEITIATEARITRGGVNLFDYINTENVDLITHESNVEGMRFKFLEDTDSFSTPFKSVNGVITSDAEPVVE